MSKAERRAMSPIPVSAAEEVAKRYGYDQVVIIARRVGGGEHVTTYGVDPANCDVAARIGNFLKHKVMGWPDSNGLTVASVDGYAALLDEAAKNLSELMAQFAATADALQVRVPLPDELNGLAHMLREHFHPPRREGA